MFKFCTWGFLGDRDGGLRKLCYDGLFSCLCCSWRGDQVLYGERSLFSLNPYELIRGLVYQMPVAADWLWSIYFHILRCNSALECVE